jgi:hydroxymethylpyrimidine/phosphomethylpyrimidine kinase
MSMRVPKALTIAGSDSGAGAGIQADLKTFSALGVYGSTVITAITAQNTLGVTAVHEIPTDIVAAQLDAVLEDIGADAAKTGMLSSAAIIETVASGVRRHRIDRLVVDPVMVAKSGDRLLREDAISALRETLLPLAFIVTPNAQEAEVLCGRPVRNEEEMREAARIIHGFGARYVVVKGGHVEGDQVVDLLFDGAHFERFALPRVATPHTHGTGCTFSAAIAAFLARGLDVSTAVWEAKQYLHRALEAAFAIGRGRSPVHHFHAWWAPAPETQ